MATLLELKSITREFRWKGLVVPAVQNLDLEVRAGEFLAIQGASGSGKSTLLGIAAGLDRPTSGEVLFRGERLDVLDEPAVAEIRRRHFGFVFQAYYLVPSLSVLENVALPRSFIGDPDAEARALELLRGVGLEHRANFLPERISGGERQRAAIARALANDPTIVFADEPTGNLDSRTGERILELLQERASGEGRALVLVTHDQRVASRATRTVEITDGRIMRTA